MTANRTNMVALATGLLLAVASQAVADDWAGKGQTLDQNVKQIAQTASTLQDPGPIHHVVTEPAESHSGAIENWLHEVDQKVDHQAGLIEWTLSRGLGMVIALVGLCAIAIAYLWFRMSQLSATIDSYSAEQSPGQAIPRVSRPMIDGASVEPGRLCARPVAEGSSRGSIPRVQFLSGVIERLAAGINLSRRRRGEVETGYALVGKIVGDGSSRIIVVNGLINEGPGATRTCGHIKFDRPYQQDELCLLQLADPDLEHMGDAHLHPGNMDRCSGGDYQTDTRNVRASHSQEMVFVIATRASAYGSSQSDESLCHAGLKLDFFYLGKASGYEYRHFRPQVVQGEPIAVSEELRRFADADPVRARLDFDNLRRLMDYRMKIGELPGDGGRGRPCVEMTHKTLRFRTLIAFSADPRQRPEVLVDDGTQLMQFQPAWLNGSWLPGLVWFTPIVLNVEREMTGRRDADTGNDIETSASVRSAHAEGKVSGPSIGDDHGKLSATEQRTGRGDSSRDVTLAVR